MQERLVGCRVCVGLSTGLIGQASWRDEPLTAWVGWCAAFIFAILKGFGLYVTLSFHVDRSSPLLCPSSHIQCKGNIPKNSSPIKDQSDYSEELKLLSIRANEAPEFPRHSSTLWQPNKSLNQRQHGGNRSASLLPCPKLPYKEVNAWYFVLQLQTCESMSKMWCVSGFSTLPKILPKKGPYSHLYIWVQHIHLIFIFW